MSNELPPLPRARHWLNGDLYRADQMREYGRACERAAYERAMEVCTITCAKNHADATNFGSVTKAYVAGCDDCHDAIRALGADK